MSSTKSKSKTLSDMEEGNRQTSQRSQQHLSLQNPNGGYKIIKHINSKTRKSSIHTSQMVPPDIIKSTEKAREYARKSNAATTIKKHWKDYKRRHPRESIIQKVVRNSLSLFSKTFSKLPNLLGGKKTRKQKSNV
jgi:hypothetical protein